MSEMLPKGWVKTTIADISVYIQRGKSPKYIDYSSLPVINQKAIRWNGLIEGCLKYIHPNQINEWSPERYIQPGDILWNSTGTGTIGRACYVTAEMAEVPKVVDSHVTIVRTSPYVASIFCFRYIQSHHIQNIVESLYTGSTNQVELSKEKINAIEIPLPPLNEQKRIVAKLDDIIPRIDAVKTRLEKIPVIIKRFRQSVLTAAVTGKLTEKWREEHPEAEIIDNLIADNTQLPFEIPETWRTTTIGSIAESSFYGPRFNRTEYISDGIPTIRTTDFTGYGKIAIKDDTPRLKLNDLQIEKYKVEIGDILITRTGTIGAMAVITDEYVAIPSAYLIRFRFKKKFTPQFIFNFMQTNFFQALMGLNQVAVTQPNLNAEKIKALPFAAPPLEEQKEIVRQVDRLFALADKLEAHYQKAKARIDKLSQSVLAKAFRGELVPQDPNDEPAEKLIERIKAEREKMMGSGRQKAKSIKRRTKA